MNRSGNIVLSFSNRAINKIVRVANHVSGKIQRDPGALRPDSNKTVLFFLGKIFSKEKLASLNKTGDRLGSQGQTGF